MELWGSFLLIGLAYCRHVSRDAYFAALALCLLLIQGNALNLFVLGALLAAFVRTPTFDALQRHLLGAPVALIALLAGIVLAADLVALPWLKRADAWGRAVAPYSFFNPQKQLAAILIFMALFFLPVARRALARPVAAWLGRLSFSVYLLHFPVLLTAGSLAYVAAGTAAAITVVLIATLAAAALFERCVDRPAIRLARALGATRHSSPGLGNGAEGGVKAPS